MAFPSLSEKEAVIIRLLVAGTELYGLQLVAKSEGALRRGTVYTTLQPMEGKGLVSSRPERPNSPEALGIPRRLYKSEKLGTRTLRALEAAAVMVDRVGCAK